MNKILLVSMIGGYPKVRSAEISMIMNVKILILMGISSISTTNFLRDVVLHTGVRKNRESTQWPIIFIVTEHIRFEKKQRMRKICVVEPFELLGQLLKKVVAYLTLDGPEGNKRSVPSAKMLYIFDQLIRV
jgi:hypothetical protein